MRGSVGNYATLEVFLSVLVLYFLVPPTRDYTDVINHVNPRNNQCKPWIKNTQEKKRKEKIFCISPR